MSMASMQSEKIRVYDGKDTIEFGAYENTGAKKTYVFNGQTVEETYAGPGKRPKMLRTSITFDPIQVHLPKRIPLFIWLAFYSNYPVSLLWL